MIPNSFQPLLASLQQATLNGQIQWRQQSNSLAGAFGKEPAYEAAINGVIVAVEVNSLFASLRILDASTKEPAFATQETVGTDDYRIVADLHDAIHRTFLANNATIRRLMDALKLPPR